jgi:hypothetical protein
MHWALLPSISHGGPALWRVQGRHISAKGLEIALKKPSSQHFILTSDPESNYHYLHSTCAETWAQGSWVAYPKSLSKKAM